ncbi:hypothetical protein JQ596_29550 [Bradyrhizobium manausense]|uniref:hypothetical protein n=1 Tax=Bradyrhizobium TaxID=374 RepID=UPI001BAD38D5|nr:MULTISPECIES: hypothetical protein [Bradyrhizobium]MBR0829686.1 hypothetical protein [Bradyrhizobium manausense]UVO25305.1 hypothetical protein KUF59_22085 [Bradyrhizobium arachidis]
MSMISLAAIPAAVESRTIDQSFKTLLLFCCVGLVASFGAMAAGVDLSAFLA